VNPHIQAAKKNTIYLTAQWIYNQDSSASKKQTILRMDFHLGISFFINKS